MKNVVGEADFARAWGNCAWLFRTLAENVDQCVYVLDREGRCLAANDAFCRWVKRSRAEILGRPVADFWPQGEEERENAEHQRVLRGERIDREDEKGGEGQAFQLRIRKAPVRDDAGIVRGVLGLFRETPIAREIVPAPQQTAKTAAHPPDDKTILMIDSDISLILLATRILSPCGYYVMAARDGRQALEIYRHHQDEIDLVLVEQNLPGQSGLEVMNELLGIHARLPIVLMSGSGTPTPAWWANTPRLGFLSKPYTPEQLVDVVRNTLG